MIFWCSFRENGSGWVVSKVDKLEITLSRLNPLNGSSCMLFPKWIRDEKATTNMKNKDNACFRRSNVRAFNPVDQCRACYEVFT